MNRELELEAAIRRSGLPFAAIGLYRALLDRADHVTAEIPPRFQPKSVRQLAEWAGMSESYCKDALNLLAEYGWVERKRPETPGRGRSTAYVLLLGQPRVRPQALGGAERTRRYRERKGAGTSVTEGAGTSVTGLAEGAANRVTSGSKSRHKAAANFVTGPGQKPVLTEGLNEGKKKGGGAWPVEDHQDGMCVAAPLGTGERRPGACPLCDQAHPVCSFTRGSLFCTDPFCGNPHHREPTEAW